MRKTKSSEELHKSNDSIYDGQNGSAFVELSNFNQNTSTRMTYSGLSERDHSDCQQQHEVLQLNEDNNTWKLTPKKLRKKIAPPRRQSNGIFSSMNKLKELKELIKHENVSEFRFRMIVFFLFLTIVLFMSLSHYFQAELEIDKAIKDQIFIQRSKRKISFLDNNGRDLLKVHFGMNIPKDVPPVSCRTIEKTSKFCLDWKYRARLSLRLRQTRYQNTFKFYDMVTCYTMRWDSYEKHSSLMDCFDMSEAHWYGMGDLYNLKWPLNRMSVPLSPFITSNSPSDLLGGSIIGRTWFLSNGVSLTVPLDVPLFISINSTENPNKICLAAKKKLPYYVQNLKNYFVHLQYNVCIAQNVTTLQNYIYETELRTDSSSQQNPTFVGKTEQISDRIDLSSQTSSQNQAQNNSPKQLNQHEIQSTKAQPILSSSSSGSSVAGIISDSNVENENIFLDRIIWLTNPSILSNFNQQTVQSYVDQITNYGLAGIILLDSRWENSTGQMIMNDVTFQNPRVLVNILHNKGFKIMLTISPNIALRSNLVDSDSDYLFKDSNLQTPLLTRCITQPKQICALINFTNPHNCERFKSEIVRELLHPTTGLSIDGIFYNGIESSRIPRNINYGYSINPDQFLENSNILIRSLPTSVGISTSVNSAGFTGYVTIHPRESTWTALQTIMPSTLSLGLLGYPLVSAGYVGGKDLFTKIKNQTEYVDKELYLRWLQLSIFMPVVQFAEPPGLSGNDLEMIKIAKKLLKSRTEHFLPAMKEALIEYQEKGSPIIRPVWWMREADIDTIAISDQFFVGNNILVAPIVESGKTERDVYLPHGWWKDEILAQVIRGGKWMRKYQVPLDKIAFFIRAEGGTAPSAN